MQESKQMELTSQEVLARLERSGRPNFTQRQLTALRGKGLLPPLERTTRTGSNSPIYVWKEEVFQQVVLLYDLMEWERRHELLYLPLWLFGTDVPFERVRQLFFTFINAQVQAFTQGEKDPDEALFQISTFIVTHLVPRWKYTPRPEEMLRRVGLEAYTQWAELFFGLLLVPSFEPDEVLLTDVFRAIQRSNQARVELVPDNQDIRAEDLEQAQHWIGLLQEALSLPQQLGAVSNATTEEWLQVRWDYATLCHFVCTMLSPLTQLMSIPEGFAYNGLVKGALFLLPPLLSLRQRGFGEWIDMAAAKANEILADPDLQAHLSTLVESQAFRDIQNRYT